MNSSFLDASYCPKLDMEVLGELDPCFAKCLDLSIAYMESQRKLIRKDVSNFCKVKAKQSRFKHDKNKVQGDMETCFDRSLCLLALEIF